MPAAFLPLREDIPLLLANAGLWLLSGVFTAALGGVVAGALTDDVSWAKVTVAARRTITNDALRNLISESPL
jgi:hypothetical protein